MQPYLVSVGIGVLVGVIYGLFQVRSPAPPVIALVGLLGILLGEQIPPLARHMWASEKVAAAWLSSCRTHVFGRMTGHAETISMTGQTSKSEGAR